MYHQQSPSNAASSFHSWPRIVYWHVAKGIARECKHWSAGQSAGFLLLKSTKVMIMRANSLKKFVTAMLTTCPSVPFSDLQGVSCTQGPRTVRSFRILVDFLMAFHMDGKMPTKTSNDELLQAFGISLSLGSFNNSLVFPVIKLINQFQSVISHC